MLWITQIFKNRYMKLYYQNQILTSDNKQILKFLCRQYEIIHVNICTSFIDKIYNF